jgi:glutamate-1-semialdehyde 2,1-aminomutase
MSQGYVSKTLKSRTLYERAKKVLPAGVSYGIRYYDPYPFYTARARGSKLYDVDGNVYVDFWLGHTALILGHSPPEVVEAVKSQLENGTHFGTCHELEIDLAEQIVRMVPSVEMVRFTNSGTEASMYAIRLARTYSGKSKIAKFEGGWHGGYDALHVGVKYPFTIPESAGLTGGAINETVLLPFNDIEGVETKLRSEKDVGTIVIEPVLGSGGGIPAEIAFLKELRALCDERDILLIFDEVITGFRLAPGGAQQYYGVSPDITIFGKIVGGGFPVGAFGGRGDIMECLDTVAHERPFFSFHGGTFAANPITMIAGLTTLKILENNQYIERLNEGGEKLRRQIKRIFEANEVAAQIVGTSSLFNVHFTNSLVKDAHDAYMADREKQVDYSLNLIENGVFVLPTHIAALSTAHSEEDLDKFLSVTEEYARRTKKKA